MKKTSSFFSTPTRMLRSPSPPPPPPWQSDPSFLSDHIFNNNNDNNQEDEEERLLLQARKNTITTTAATTPPWFNYTVDYPLHDGFYSDIFQAFSSGGEEEEKMTTAATTNPPLLLPSLQNPVFDFSTSCREVVDFSRKEEEEVGGIRSCEKIVSSSSSSGCWVNTCRKRRRGKRVEEEKEVSDDSDFEIGEEGVGVRKRGFCDASAGAVRGSGSKRSRAAEVHNLSERRRRDRINEKMKALQELIPNCNKVDKASMLEEAIEYLKTLQIQVQMMAVGTRMCMPPWMFHPGATTHFPYFDFGAGSGTGVYEGSGMVEMGGVFQPSPDQGPNQGHPLMNHERMMGESHVHHIPSTPLSLLHPSQTFIHGGLSASNSGVSLANKSVDFHGFDLRSLHGPSDGRDIIHTSSQRKGKGYSESDLVKGRC